MTSEEYLIYLSIITSNDALLGFLENNDLLCMIRSNQVQDNGYRFYNWNSDDFPSIINIFSCPDYNNTNNKAAVLILQNNNIKIKQFKKCTQPYYLPNFINLFDLSIPYIIDKVTEIIVSLLDNNYKLENILSNNNAIIVDKNDNIEHFIDNYNKNYDADRIKVKVITVGKLMSLLKNKQLN